MDGWMDGPHTGRGLTEFFGVPLEEVDIMSVSTSHALGTVGGMCVGTTEVRTDGRSIQQDDDDGGMEGHREGGKGCR